GHGELPPPARAIWEGPRPPRPRAAGAAAFAAQRRAARQLRVALAGAAQSDRRERRAARRAQGAGALRRGARLFRRNAAARSQTLFRLDRPRAPGRCRLAPPPMTGQDEPMVTIPLQI